MQALYNIVILLILDIIIIKISNENWVYYNILCMLMAIITFSCSLIIILLGSDRSIKRIYPIILSIGQVIKSMICIIFVYVQIIGHGHNIGVLLWLQYEVIDLIGIGLYLMQYKRNKSLNAYTIATIYIVGCLGCLLLRKDIATYLAYFFPIIIILAIIGVVVSKVYRKYPDNVLVKARYYFTILLATYLFVLLVQREMGQHYIYQHFFVLVQTYILFIAVYKISILEPLKQKLKPIDEETKKLEKQYEECRDIVNMSHELKAPVCVIKSALTILTMDLKDNSMIQEVEQLKMDCKDTISIIQDMIDLQKLRGKQEELCLEDENLVEMMDEIVDAFAIQGYQGRIIFDPMEEEIYIKADRKLFQKAWILLIGLHLQEPLTEQVIIQVKRVDKKRKVMILLKSSHNHLAKYIGERKGSFAENKDDKENYSHQQLTMHLILFILQLHKVSYKSYTSRRKQVIEFILKAEAEQQLEETRQEDEKAYLEEYIEGRYKIQ